jgi:hypothetical protein
VKWRKKRIDLRPLVGESFNSVFEVDTWCKIKRIDQIQFQRQNEDDQEQEEEQEEPNKQIKLDQNDNRQLFDNNTAQNLTND